MTLRFAERNLPTFPDQGAVLVAPWGYDEGGPHPLGEDDLLRVISEMSAAYAIDPRRVSLTGYSLGGTVAFVAPLHHPDVFSAAAPLCGYPNLLAYSSVAGVPHAPWEDALLARKYIVNWAENGAYLPLHVVHGGLDVPGRSKVVVDRYKALGFPVDFDVQDDLDHDVWDYAYEDGKMVAWLAGRSRPKAPKRVRFVTGEYRYDRAYWLRVIGLRDSAAGELGSVDATFDEKAREVTVKTSALTAFAIDRAALGAAAKDEPLSIVVDGEPLSATAGSDTAFLVRSDRWSVSADEPSRAGMKRHGVSGPLDDVLRHRVIVVYGTKSRAHATANRLVAEHFARAGGLAEVSYPILADTEATGDAVKGASLVLVGSPEDNAVTAAYAATLPIRFESGGIVVRGERYEGPGVGVSFIAPRPDDPGEYVVVHAGVDERGLLASRFLPRYLPDYVVYDARAAAQRGGLLMDQRPYLAGGSFGEDWK
jgi:predicted esterase